MLIWGAARWTEVQADINFDVIFRYQALSRHHADDPASLIDGIGGLIRQDLVSSPGAVRSDTVSIAVADFLDDAKDIGKPDCHGRLGHLAKSQARGSSGGAAER